jgi:hypothetical protein
MNLPGDASGAPRTRRVKVRVRSNVRVKVKVEPGTGSDPEPGSDGGSGTRRLGVEHRMRPYCFSATPSSCSTFMPRGFFLLYPYHAAATRPSRSTM